jgi:hypothetical protein
MDNRDYNQDVEGLHAIDFGVQIGRGDVIDDWLTKIEL